MPAYSTFPNAKRVKALLYGESKAGKTSLIASLANAGFKVRVLDVDCNMQIVEEYLKPEAASNLYYERAAVSDPECWTKCKQLLLERPWGEFGTVKSWPSDTVLVVDTGSFMGDACMTYFKKKFQATRATQFEQAIYGDMSDEYLKVIAAICSDDYKCDIVFMCHTRQISENDAKKYAAIPGKVAPKKLPTFFNSCWLLESKSNGERVIKTKNHPFMALATIAPGKVQAEEKPDLGEIFKKIKA